MSPDALVLRTLRAATVHLPPGEIATHTALPRPAVESSLAALRNAGFDIETKPGLGCRLLASPDRLIADDLLARIGSSCPVAKEILVFEETTSTNDIAAKLGRQSHRGGLAIFAEKQTAGRGRFGRRWDSAPRAGLWFSLLLRPTWPQAHWPRLTTWAGVAVAQTAGPGAQIKWPNDVLIAGKKIAGILIETATDADGQPFAVVGIGVNVNQTEFPPEIATTATSLSLTAGRTVDRVEFAANLLTQLGATFHSMDFGKLLATAQRRSSLLGTWVRLHAGTETHEGLAESLDENGSLTLRLTDGSTRTMTAGEVTLRAQ